MNTGGGSDNQKEGVGLETGCPGVVKSVFARDCTRVGRNRISVRRARLEEKR